MESCFHALTRLTIDAFFGRIAESLPKAIHTADSELTFSTISGPAHVVAAIRPQAAQFYFMLVTQRCWAPNNSSTMLRIWGRVQTAAVRGSSIAA